MWIINLGTSMGRILSHMALFGAVLLSACAVSPSGSTSGQSAKTTPSDIYIVNSQTRQRAKFDTYKITAEEAKTHACPQSVLETRRVTAIEVIRIDAFEACGFFEDGHPVGEGL